MNEILNQLEQTLLSVNHVASKEILNSVENNFKPIELIEKIIVPVMNRIGEGWEKGTVALSQVYMSGKFIEEWVDTILPPGDPERTEQPKMAIAVLEDYHMLGKRIVYSLLRASGFELKDYGHVTVKKVVRQIQEDKIQILLISTLMLHSALKVKELKEEIKNAGLSVKVVVGGAPFRFDEELWKEVGADAMAFNANDSIQVINNLMEEKK